MKRLVDLIALLALALFAVAICTLSGCAAKKPVKLPARAGTEIEFRGVRDGHCSVKDVLLDAKTGNYILICK